MNLSLDAGNSPAPETKTTNVGGRALICKERRARQPLLESTLELTEVHYQKSTRILLLDDTTRMLLGFCD
jgi:hypothetical protein